MSVKDFRAAVSHAETLRTTVTAQYSVPTRPLLLSYKIEGIVCEITLMTSGDYRGAMEVHLNSTHPGNRNIDPTGSVTITSQTAESNAETQTIPQPSPSRIGRGHTSLNAVRKRLVDKSTTQETGSLFVPLADEDRAWEPETGPREDEDIIGWDATADNVCISISILKWETNAPPRKLSRIRLSAIVRHFRGWPRRATKKKV